MTREQCEALAHRFEANQAAARKLFDNRPAQALLRRPAEGSWSAAECVVHLNATTAATLPVLRAGIEETRSRDRRRLSRSRADWIGWLLAWFLEPPARFKTRTPAPFEPVRVGTPAEVLAEFLAGNADIVAALREAPGLDLSAVKIRSPFEARIRYNVIAGFRILETHQRRHLAQAQVVAGSNLAAPGNMIRSRREPTMGSLTQRRTIGVFALVAGAAIAWVDTRPSWDDTGITAGLLFVAGGLAGVLGLSWWLSALLVACPIILVELRSTGWGILIALAFTAVGSVLGTLLRGFATRRDNHEVD